MVKIIYMDTETTGTDTKRCAITQIACVVRVGGVEESFSALMSPHDGAEISDEALVVQGRTREQIAAFPSPKIALVDFQRFLGKFVDKFDKNDKFFLFGYNVGFDADMVREWFIRNGDNYFGSWFWTPPIDVMSIAARALMEDRVKLPNFRLVTVAKHLFPGDPEVNDESSYHDAMFDVRMTRKILKVLGVSVSRQEAANVR